ncbi:hypothetical protein M0811_05493 [Anaeramoeba ignava]|uniref:DDE-1 domain-containing protein n=1 Tax=Anaeramoeba ignava TaxID=1746090 RepID=A0A9Q0RFK5_ANAIG|nr:hypothetical protein M0811_05493 [Anaeramoeba ignava]
MSSSSSPSDFDDISETEKFHLRCEKLYQNYRPENIWNINESNLQYDYTRETTLSPRGKKQVLARNKINQKQSCTLIGCIAGDGNKLPLGFIFKEGKYAKKWMREDTPCVLIVDNFKTHINSTFIEFAKKKEVLIELIPQNMTGQLRPLDKLIFRQFKGKYKEEITGIINKLDCAQTKRTKVSEGCIKIWNSILGLTITNSFRLTGIIKPSDEFICFANFY